MTQQFCHKLWQFSYDWYLTTFIASMAGRLGKTSKWNKPVNTLLFAFSHNSDTLEFANIGVILYAPTTHEFVFKLLSPNDDARITAFFAKLDKVVLHDILKLLEGELGRVQKLSYSFHDFNLLYNELIRPREGTIQHSSHTACFTTNPSETINELFEHYIHRSRAEKSDEW